MEDIELGQAEATKTLAEARRAMPANAKLQWAPEEGTDNLGAAIRQAVGAASTCWESLAGAGTFDSSQALLIAEGLEEWITANAIATIEVANGEVEIGGQRMSQAQFDAARRPLQELLDKGSVLLGEGSNLLQVQQELDGRRQLQISRQRETISNILSFLGERGLTDEFSAWLRSLSELHPAVDNAYLNTVVESTSGTRDHVELYTADNGESGWRRIAPNGQIVSVAGETFKSMSGALRSARRNNSNVLAFIIKSSDPAVNSDKEDGHGREAEQGHATGSATRREQGHEGRAE